MFNINTLLSVFNEKGTLLKWLQKVEEALKGDTLKEVQVSQTTPDTMQLNFIFKDNTNLLSDIIDLPRGENGANGSTITAINSESPEQIDGYTETKINVVTNDSETPLTFKVKAKNGENGANGRGVTAFGSGNPAQDTEKPGYTVTPVSAVYTDGTSQSSFKVYAKNGTGAFYVHNLHIIYASGNGNIVATFTTQIIDDIQELYTVDTFMSNYNGKLLTVTGQINLNSTPENLIQLRLNGNSDDFTHETSIGDALSLGFSNGNIETNISDIDWDSGNYSLSLTDELN